MLRRSPRSSTHRLEDLKKHAGIGYCNITRCRTVVCPEHITDNAIIPLKERVVDQSYGPLECLFRLLTGGRKKQR